MLIIICVYNGIFIHGYIVFIFSDKIANVLFFSYRFGDITPISIAGKCFSMFWALAGLILCGFLTGALSSVLTASENPLAAPSVPKTGVSFTCSSYSLLYFKAVFN